jgi:hypothetical protein
VWIFDHSCGHDHGREDGFSVGSMKVNWGKKQSKVRDVVHTLAYVPSKKQKCMSKSPTEAQLIALTDNLGLVELFHEFWSL